MKTELILNSVYNHSYSALTGVAAHITAPFMKRINDYTSGRHTQTYYSNLGALKTEYANSIQNDVVNMFKNLRNYYDINKSFDGLTNSIVSENNSVMAYNDLEYMYEFYQKSGIKDKLDSAYEIISQGGKFEDIEDIYNDIDNIINNMDCSDIFKDIYRQLLMGLRKD